MGWGCSYSFKRVKTLYGYSRAEFWLYGCGCGSCASGRDWLPVFINTLNMMSISIVRMLDSLPFPPFFLLFLFVSFSCDVWTTLSDSSFAFHCISNHYLNCTVYKRNLFIFIQLGKRIIPEPSQHDAQYFIQLNNSKNQNPCLVAAYLQQACMPETRRSWQSTNRYCVIYWSYIRFQLPLSPLYPVQIRHM